MFQFYDIVQQFHSVCFTMIFVKNLFFFVSFPFSNQMFCRFACDLHQITKEKGERKYRTRWWMVNYRRVSSRKNHLGSKKWNENENETKRDATQLTCFAAALVFVGRNSRSQDAAGWFLATLDGLPRRGLNQSRRRFRSINVAFDHRQNAAAAAAVPILHELHQGKMADRNQRINSSKVIHIFLIQPCFYNILFL